MWLLYDHKTPDQAPKRYHYVLRTDIAIVPHTREKISGSEIPLRHVTAVSSTTTSDTLRVLRGRLPLLRCTRALMLILIVSHKNSIISHNNCIIAASSYSTYIRYSSCSTGMICDIILRSGVDLEQEKTIPGIARCCFCCSWSYSSSVAPRVFGSRPPRCSCVAMAQHSYSKNTHQQDGALKRSFGGSHLRLWALRRRHCSTVRVV